SSCPNPGPLEAATWDVRRLVSLDTYDGVRVDISKQLSPYFAVVHSFHLGTSMLPDGRTSSYGFTTQMNDEEGFCMARVDPERGTMDGRIHKALFGGVAMAKLQVGTSSEGSNDQLLGEIDLGAQTWTANLKYGSMGGGNVFGCNYFQSVTPRLAMGGEGMYIGANGNMMSSYTAKYSFNPSNSGDGDERQGMLSLNYKRAITPSRVNIGASLECSPATLESQVMVGAEFNLTRSKMNVCVDGTGRIQSTLEAKLGREQGSPSLNFAAELDHGKSLMRFGYGLNIG
ncbi:tom40-like protein, partial [Thalassiosira pseudonana CCMP1335]